MANTNEYMRDYLRARYARVRAKIIEHLGGKCVRCGSTRDLEVDHIDPAKKTMGMAAMVRSSWSRVLEELKNCQLLCDEHHNEKTVLETGRKIAKGTHGTLSSYRYCKCEACRKAKADWTKEYKRPTRSSMAVALD